MILMKMLQNVVQKMSRNNPWYQRCRYLKTTFVDKGISSYCKHDCTLYGHSISERHGIKLMCCLSNSPYQVKNCTGFKDKSGLEQQSLTDYTGENNK